MIIQTIVVITCDVINAPSVAMYLRHSCKKALVSIIIISLLSVTLYFTIVNLFSLSMGNDSTDNEIRIGLRISDVENDLSLEELLNELVVVTGFSSNHYNEAQDMLGSVHHFLPKTPIIIYDVGMDNEQVKALKELKNVEVRKYDFEANGRTNYRKIGHGAGLGCYAWKIFVMDEVSREHKVFAWLDASIRLIKPITSSDCVESLNNIPLSACFNHMYSRRMMQFTDEGTVKHLNITRQQMKDVVGFMSGCLMFKMTEKMRLLMEKWVDCAYNEECICGTKATRIKGYCNFSEPQSTKFIPGCHRYDQATLNWLSAIYLGMDKVDKVAKSGCKEIFIKDRQPTFDWRQHLVRKTS